MNSTRHYHLTDEALERFIDNSESYSDHYNISRKEHDTFYSNLLQYGYDGWDLWNITYYSEAVKVLKYIINSGRKVKVINKGNTILILYKVK